MLTEGAGSPAFPMLGNRHNPSTHTNNPSFFTTDLLCLFLHSLSLATCANLLTRQLTRLPAAEVFAALRARNIIVRYFPGPLTGAYLRVTIGTDPEMDQFLAALREILD